MRVREIKSRLEWENNPVLPCGCKKRVSYCQEALKLHVAVWDAYFAWLAGGSREDFDNAWTAKEAHYKVNESPSGHIRRRRSSRI